jgi:peptidoglycan/xylan/chitin deacetylase (PgdA/CDA1 family)
MNLKSIAKPMLEEAAHALGAVRMVRAANRKRPRILMYHRFQGGADQVRAQLTSQCEHMQRHYHPVSLDEVAQATREGTPLPQNALAITVDDGYRDFASAFPIFLAHGLKVTLYVVAGFASGELWLWPDQLLYLLEKSPRSEASLVLPDGTAVRYPLNDEAARRSAFGLLCEFLIRMNNEDRLATMGCLPGWLDIELPARAPERFAALSWAELRTLSQQGLDVGAHTQTHPIVSKVETEEGLRREIGGCKSRIESHLRVAVNHFCYPNGKFPDVNQAAKLEAERAGFRTAVLAEAGFAEPEAGLFQMKRIGVEPDYPPRFFERCIAGYRL